MIKSITLESFTHKSKMCIAIKFPYDFETKEYIKKFQGVYWTKTHRTFYIYYDEIKLEDLKNHLKKADLLINEIDDTKNIPRIS